MLVLLTVVAALLATPARAGSDQHCSEASIGAQSAPQSTEYQTKLQPGLAEETFAIPNPGTRKTGVHVWACDSEEPPRVSFNGLAYVYVGRNAASTGPVSVTITIYFE